MAVKGAGQLNRRIVVQQNNSSSTNSFNEPVDNWETLCTRAAKRMDVSDSEKFSVGQDMGELVCRFEVRSDSTTRSIDTKHRISHDSRIWDIHGVKETSQGHKRYIEITASARSS